MCLVGFLTSSVGKNSANALTLSLHFGCDLLPLLLVFFLLFPSIAASSESRSSSLPFWESLNAQWRETALDKLEREGDFQAKERDLRRELSGEGAPPDRSDKAALADDIALGLIIDPIKTSVSGLPSAMAVSAPSP